MIGLACCCWLCCRAPWVGMGVHVCLCLMLQTYEHAVCRLVTLKRQCIWGCWCHGRFRWHAASCQVPLVTASHANHHLAGSMTRARHGSPAPPTATPCGSGWTQTGANGSPRTPGIGTPHSGGSGPRICSASRRGGILSGPGMRPAKRRRGGRVVVVQSRHNNGC